MTGQIYKHSGTKAIIRPDEWGSNRRDVILDNKEKKYKIGDKLTFDIVRKNNRSYAENVSIEA